MRDYTEDKILAMELWRRRLKIVDLVSDETAVLGTLYNWRNVGNYDGLAKLWQTYPVIREPNHAQLLYIAVRDQTDFARRIGYSNQTISRSVEGEKGPFNINKLALFLSALTDQERTAYSVLHMRYSTEH